MVRNSEVEGTGNLLYSSCIVQLLDGRRSFFGASGCEGMKSQVEE